MQSLAYKSKHKHKNPNKKKHIQEVKEETKEV